jgi:hypothetical protein
MVPVMSLWLPILLSAVLVFVVSSVIHMFLTYHNSDLATVPGEEQVRAALRSVPPGDYAIPRAGSMAGMSSPEFIKKMTEGPVVIMTVRPNGPPTMTKSLVQWFLYSILVSVFAAYIAGRALAPGATYLDAFRFAGTTAFVGYGLALLQGSIWWGRKWSATLKTVFDALVYALVTAGVFGWRWPAM